MNFEDARPISKFAEQSGKHYCLWSPPIGPFLHLAAFGSIRMIRLFADFGRFTSSIPFLSVAAVSFSPSTSARKSILRWLGLPAPVRYWQEPPSSGLQNEIGSTVTHVTHKNSVLDQAFACLEVGTRVRLQKSREKRAASQHCQHCARAKKADRAAQGAGA